MQCVLDKYLFSKGSMHVVSKHVLVAKFGHLGQVYSSSVPPPTLPFPVPVHSGGPGWAGSKTVDVEDCSAGGAFLADTPFTGIG